MARAGRLSPPNSRAEEVGAATGRAPGRAPRPASYPRGVPEPTAAPPAAPLPAAPRPPRVRRVSPLFALTGLLALAAAGGALALRDAPAGGVAAAQGPRAHYLYVSELEVEAKKPDGSAWDVGGGLPDPKVEIHWRGVQVFESATKQDTLVAHWSAASLGLDTLRDASKDAVVRAARVVPEPGSGAVVTFRVLDADLVADDEVASWTVRLEDLPRGKSVVRAPAAGIRYVAYELVPCDEAGLDLVLK